MLGQNQFGDGNITDGIKPQPFDLGPKDHITKVSDPSTSQWTCLGLKENVGSHISSLSEAKRALEKFGKMPLDMITLNTHDAARKLELNQGNISGCARGKDRRTGGYEFKWAEPNEPALLPGEEWAELTDADLARARSPLSRTT